MRPLYYVNLSLRGGSEKSFGISCALMMTQLLAKLHPHFKAAPGTYAIDFPGARKNVSKPRLGSVLRIFAEHREEIDAIAEAVDANVRLAGLVLVGRTRRAPEEPGAWVRLHRFRLTQRSQPNNRMRGLDESRGMPFIRMRSGTNGHRYPLTILRKHHAGGPAFGSPNSYGFSSRVDPVCLPDLGTD